MACQIMGVAPQPDSPSPALKVRLQKTKLCQFHMRSACKDGSNCRFAHGPEELVNQPDLSKTSMCPDLVTGNGKCTRPGCQYAHSAEEIRTTNFCYKTTQCMWYAMGKCRNGSNCRFAHGEADSRQTEVTNTPGKVFEDRAEKSAKEKSTKDKRQTQPQRKQAKELAEPDQGRFTQKKLAEPMFISSDRMKPMKDKVQATPKYLSVPPQVMGYPDTAHLLPPPGLGGNYNMAAMMQEAGMLYNQVNQLSQLSNTMYHDTSTLYQTPSPSFNAPSSNMAYVPQPLVPEQSELSDLFNHLTTLTEQVKKLQDSVNQTMRSDSDCSTYSGPNDERVPSETSETSFASHDLDNMGIYGPMGNTLNHTLLLDNKLY
eukprot:gnl/MRDRNA2_/MRDRNA2_60986_c1_seq1.p1 gnl/MRDRNA2_/MRDRNA2_60986_c1~~gnl/MRDRNA2_/MRDRNA2_60986_c1_seq1.p1  ORF type:complete len:371 (-),score=54.28 gnl/MRDRNA2_/MRDRNA2_60986_c1_seq1:418-1530(-)